MGKIFYLMGKSASGKDTIYNRLLAQPELSLNNVVPYTTRPMRTGEKNGETYFFCSDEEAGQMEEKGQVIELRAYDTVHGVWKYFTADDGQIDLSKKDYLMIGTLEGYEGIRSYYGKEAVCPIYVWVDDEQRILRAFERERKQEDPKYSEMCRRFLADEDDFSQEKLKHAGIDVTFENEDLEEGLVKIISYIKESAKES